MGKKNNPALDPDAEYIYLSDENGKDRPYEILDLVDYDGEQYAVLLPLVGEDPDVEIVKVIEIMDEESNGYVGLNDEEILSAVFDLFMEHVEEAEAAEAEEEQE